MQDKTAPSLSCQKPLIFALGDAQCDADSPPVSHDTAMTPDLLTPDLVTPDGHGQDFLPAQREAQFSPQEIVHSLLYLRSHYQNLSLGRSYEREDLLNEETTWVICPARHAFTTLPSLSCRSTIAATSDTSREKQ